MRRVAVLIGLALGQFGLIISQPIDASADPTSPPDGRPDCTSTRTTGGCLTEEAGGHQSPGDSSANVSIPARKCYAGPGGEEIPCTDGDAYWHSTYRCYLTPYHGQRRDLLAYVDTEEPEEGFVRMICTYLDGSAILFDIPESEAEPPPDPRRIAWQLVAEVGFRAGKIGILPDNDHAIVGMPTWLWVDDPGPKTIGPITKSTTAQGYTVSIEARLDRVVYDMGDGTTVTCEGDAAPGTRYLERYKLEDSPTCGHRYTETGIYSITAQSFWVVEWSGVGQAGSLALEFTRTTQSHVGELVSVNR